MIVQLIEAGILIADFAYHRWQQAHAPREKLLPQEVSIPRVDAGCPVPLIYGRVRVKAPILVWTDTPSRDLGAGVGINGYPSGVTFYKMNMFFVVGIPFQSGTTRMYNMWAGDRKFGGGPWAVGPGLAITTEISGSSSTDGTSDVGLVGSQAVYYDGNPAQDLGVEEAGVLMTASGVDIFQVPSYYDFLSIILYDTTQQWTIGSSPNVAAYSFEASSYQDSHGYPAVGVYAAIGQESNPINVIYDLLTSDLKLGLPASYIDFTSFQTAASTCYTEGNGYSRTIETTKPASEHIQEILRQIDGAIDEDPSTGKLVIKLIRADYNPSTILHVTKDNCDKLTGFAMGGWTGLQSSVRLEYTNRAKDYADDNEISHNQGNATNQGETEELVVQMPGVCTQLLAANMARREVAATLRPIMKFRVLVGREFLRCMRGDPIKVTWNGPDIAGLIFRVADIDRGTIEDGKIALDLIQDYFYTYRSSTPVPPQKIDIFSTVDVTDAGP